MAALLQQRRRTLLVVGLVSVAVVALLYSPGPAAAKRGADIRIPLQNAAVPKVLGKTLGEWSARWWQQVLAIPADSNPLPAEGEVDCSWGESGPVVFLAGNTGGSTVRTCSVPQGKALFFPIVNSIFWNDIVDGVPEEATVAEKREALNGVLDLACTVTATLDGDPVIFSGVPIVRVQSPPFRREVGENDLFGGTAGVVDPEAIADGFWVMLPAPSPGEHVVQFAGAVCDPETGEAFFSVDVTYELEVEPRRGRHLDRDK